MKNTVKINESSLKNIVKKSITKILKESAQYTQNPSIYVGTYGKYNSGSLEGVINSKINI